MPNGTMYRDLEPGEPIYFGIPSPEIDQAWGDLLYSSGLDLEGEEANSVKNETFEEPLGNMWRTGLDLFHALHCVVSTAYSLFLYISNYLAKNLIRKALDSDHYPVSGPPNVVRMHRGIPPPFISPLPD
jgi:hypothetical protein